MLYFKGDLLSTYMKKILSVLLFCAIVPVTAHAEYSFSQNQATPSTNSAFIEVINNTESICQLNFGSSSGNLSQTFVSEQGTDFRPPETFHSFRLINLTPNTAYYYKVSCRTRDNQNFDTGISSFSTLNVSGGNPYVRVIEPNGGETTYIGDTVTIRWEQQNISDRFFRISATPTEFITINGGITSEIDDYVKDFSTSVSKWKYSTAPFSTSNGIQTYSWTIPTNLDFILYRKFKIYIEAKAEDGRSVSDTSDAFFNLGLKRPTNQQTQNQNQSNQSEAASIVNSGSNLDSYISYMKRKKSSADQKYAYEKLTLPLDRTKKLKQQQLYAINNFIVYGSRTKGQLSARQRFDLVKKFQNKYKYLPTTEAHWKTLLTM